MALSGKQMKKRLVFVIDDDPLVLKLAEHELKKLRLEVMSFSYGEDCLRELYLRPDLIILDYVFVNKDKHVMSGLDILREIRKVMAEVPVIILSGQESGSAVLELIKLGIEEYIIKENNFISRLREAVFNSFEGD
jgi:two-component system, NtrC family, response regulator AtoC